MNEYRILERWGEVHIQQRARFMFFTWWSTLETHHYESANYPIDFLTVEGAKSEIDRRREIHHKIYEVPTKITTY